MKLWERLKEKEFEAIFKDAYRYYGKYIVIFVSPKVKRKVGFVASKKIGPAHKRNRAKRLMREAFLKVEPILNEDVSFILIARPAIVGVKMQDVLNDLEGFVFKFKKGHKDREEA